MTLRVTGLELRMLLALRIFFCRSIKAKLDFKKAAVKSHLL